MCVSVTDTFHDMYEICRLQNVSYSLSTFVVVTLSVKKKVGSFLSVQQPY